MKQNHNIPKLKLHSERSPKGEIYSYKCLDKKTKFSNQQPVCTTKGTSKRRANETQSKMVERINETNFQGPTK